MQRSGLHATGLLNDEWHPQFALALSEAKRIKEQYEAAGYSVSVTGHGAGGSIAQLASYTLDLPGNAFDPLGAKNLTESRGYAQWCRENGIDPQERAENSLILRGHGQQRPGDRPFTHNATADTPAGCRVFAVQGDPQNPAHLRTGMDMQTALSTPLEQAFNQAQQAVATLSPQQDLLAQSADEHSQRISAMH